MAFRRRARVLLEYLELEDGMDVLDCGCGMGFYLMAMGEAARPSPHGRGHGRRALGIRRAPRHPRESRQRRRDRAPVRGFVVRPDPHERGARARSRRRGCASRGASSAAAGGHPRDLGPSRAVSVPVGSDQCDVDRRSAVSPSAAGRSPGSGRITRGSTSPSRWRPGSAMRAWTSRSASKPRITACRSSTSSSTASGSRSSRRTSCHRNCASAPTASRGSKTKVHD